MKQSDFLAKIDQERIKAAITAAEERTSGEIRVHIQPKSHGEPRHVAEKTFERLGMTKTDLRNGVLLYIASEEQQFVILGDKGIDEKVPAGFWDVIAAHLAECFREGRFTDGIVDTIHSAGAELSAYFPRAHDDRNELTNDLSINH